jgi:hypothetical protein
VVEAVQEASLSTEELLQTQELLAAEGLTILVIFLSMELELIQPSIRIQERLPLFLVLPAVQRRLH